MVVGTRLYVLGTWSRASSSQVSLLQLLQLTVLLSLLLPLQLPQHLQHQRLLLALSALLTTCPSKSAGGSLPPVDNRPIRLRHCGMRCG